MRGLLVMNKKERRLLPWLKSYAVCFVVMFVWQILSDWFFDGDPWKSCTLRGFVSVGVTVLIVCAVLACARRNDNDMP